MSLSETSNMRLKAIIDLNNIKHNVLVQEQHLGGATPILAIVKADAYGHGAPVICRNFDKMDCIYGYGVASIEEALALREQGIRKPILIIGVVFEEDFVRLLENDIMCSIVSYEMAKELSVIAKVLKKTARVHIKIDTGMHRIGFMCNSQSADEIYKISQLDNIAIEGCFTHFARADETDKKYAREQYRLFDGMRQMLEGKGVEISKYHCANSAAIIDLPDYHMDMVRAGISIYGLWPSDEVERSVQLKPAMSLISHVSFVKTLDKGDEISYGGTYKLSKKTVVATVPVGYADGYPRSLSNKGYVLINGQKAPILGRVCMDQFMVDVTSIKGVKIGSEVVLLGSQKNATITCEELGDLSGRFNYEFVCDINKRVKRIYVD